MAGRPDQETEDGVLTTTKRRLQRPPLYHVVMHNDDYTTQELVIDILCTIFHHNEAAATHVMLTIHNRGKGIAGTYARDIAESKVAQATDYARAKGAPLKLTLEPQG